MKKNIILTVALTAVMSQTAFAADAATSATSTTTTKPATTSSKPTTSKPTTSKTNTSKTTTAATKPATVTAKPGDTSYVVKYGDTLNDIAVANGTTTSALASYNKIANANRIYVGQTIIIPGKATTTTTVITSATDVVYTVVSGDTLDKIAKAHGTTYQKLAKANNLSNPNKLSIGQKITIPGTGEVVTPVTPVKPVTPVTPEKPVVDPVTPVTPEKPVVDPVAPVTPDVVTTASLVSSADELATSLSSAGTWITCPLNDVTVDGELNVEGTFYNKNDKTKGEYRKLGLYTQDENKKVLEQFELNVDKMNVKSPNFKIQNGTVNGDIYVTANGFTPACTVNGNIVFATREAMSSADLSGLKLGEGFTVSVAEADTVSSASITDNANDVVGSLSKTGNWITCTTADVTIPGTLTVEGTFYNKNDVSKGAYRKLGLYTQDENKKVTGEFALNVDKMDVKSPNFKIQNGTVNGDIYVSAKGFTPACTVNGNIVFANREAMATANLSGLKLGEGFTVSVAEQAADAVTTPSITTDAKELATAVGTKGNWIACTEGDVTVNGDLTIEGNFYSKNDYTRGLDRKIALYTQDADKKVTGEFALNVANLNVLSPNTRIVHGTVNGNVNVKAAGFKPQCTINGNVVFATQELMDSADLTGATINGTVSVAPAK